jgi:hypothetical protein
MKLTTLYFTSLIISFVLTIFGAAFKILHLPLGSIMLFVGMITSPVYIILGLIDVAKHKPLASEKLMWLVGFLFLHTLAGILYFPQYKKHNSQ